MAQESGAVDLQAAATQGRAAQVMADEARLLVGKRTPRTRVVWQSAQGDTVTDVEGRQYLDFTSGVLVANLGHCHPKLVAAIAEQAEQLLNCYDAPHPNRVAAAEAILRHVEPPLTRVLFTTTGTESIENAIKLARAYTGRQEIISFQGGFHGKSYLSMALGGDEALRRGFGPFTTGITHVPFPYCYRCPFGHEPGSGSCPLHGSSYLEWALKTQTSSDLAAVIVEPYQGAGGCVLPPTGFLEAVQEFCRRHGALLILDEVQTGFGRTGKWFAYQHYDIQPDIVCSAKGLANGVPASVVITTDDIADSVAAGSVSSTYGGNPLATAAIAATVRIMEEEGVVENCARLAPVFAEGLQRLLDFDIIGEARSIGLVCGVEFVKDRTTKEPALEWATQVVEEAARRGLVLILPTGLLGNVLRAMPPLTITEERLREGLEILYESVAAVARRARG